MNLSMAYRRFGLPTSPRYLEKCLERFGIASAGFQKLLLMESAIFQAWFRDDEQKANIWSQRSEAGPAASLLNQLRLAICMDWTGRRLEELTSAWEKGRIHIEALPSSPAADRLKNAWLEWKDQIDKKLAACETISKP
jgi:hypothetical protein